MKHHWKDSTLRQVTALLQQALNPLADIHVAALPSGSNPGHVLQGPLIRLRDEKGGVTTLVILPRGSEEESDHPHTPLWVLQRAARSVHDELRRRDQNFVDTTGTVRLHLPGILVDRTDLKAPVLHGSPQVRNPFSDRNSLVVRALVGLPANETMTVQETAERAGISLATASYVIRALEKSRLVITARTARGREVRLVSAEQLVHHWTRQYDWTRNAAVTLAAPIGVPERFLPRLSKVLTPGRWALTLHAGAALVAPHAHWDHVHCYVDADDQAEVLARARSAGWEPAPEGRLTLLRPYYKRSIWESIQTVGGYPVVSNLQLVLDLWHYPVRGREQALHLMETHPLMEEGHVQRG